MSDIQTQIKSLITKDKIVLFMKGTADFPMCGFSSTTVAILNQLGTEFTTINVLESDDIRQGIKDFSDWPTIPQLYINGEFIGGCDIIREMFEAGELQPLVA